MGLRSLITVEDAEGDEDRGLAEHDGMSRFVVIDLLVMMLMLMVGGGEVAVSLNRGSIDPETNLDIQYVTYAVWVSK